MTDRRTDDKPALNETHESVTEDSGAGYGNNAESGGTEAPGEDEDDDKR